MKKIRKSGLAATELTINWREATEFVELLAGEPDPIVTWQVFDDKKRHNEWAEHRQGRLGDKEIRKWLARKTRKGCGVYMTVNATDGRGRRRTNVTAARATWIDLDGAPLPKEWPVKPTIIIETSPGRYQAFWLIQPEADLNKASDTQARLAAFYGADPSITDPSRVCRVPGFYHQKREPFRVRAAEMVEFWSSAAGERHNVESLADAHPCEYKSPARRGNSGRVDEPQGGWDNEVDIIRARTFLETAPPSVEGQQGNKNAFRIACVLNDLGISPEKSLELMQESWNDRCQPQWSIEELEQIITNTTKYKSGDAGSHSAASDFADTVGDDWLELGTTQFMPPSMQFDMNRLPDMLDHAEICMLTGGAPIYQMGGRLVHPVRHDTNGADDNEVRRTDGALVVKDVQALRLREYMIEHASFYRLAPSRSTGQLVRSDCPVPLQLANHYLAREDKWKLPSLRGVIEAPTLRRDGTLLTSGGYDEESGLLLDTGGVEYPEIPDHPTMAQARAALDKLKWPFQKFPFVDRASRSVMLSAALTALVRRTLHSAPMHGTTAPLMGTGKTLACNVVAMIAMGRQATAMSQGASEEEDEKRIFSVLLQNDLITLIDNVKRPVEGDALCTILTEPTWQSRILGESRKVIVPTNTLLMVSGNNLTFKGDMTTRALLCRMDANMERPETRRFDVDLKVEVPKRRPELVAAGLTVLRAFVVAGRPGLDRLQPFGRFEEWSDLVRGALVWLGEADPCATRAYIAVDDPERATLLELLQAMHAHDPGHHLSPGAWINLAEQDQYEEDVLLSAIVAVAPDANKKRFGHYLKAQQGRIASGLRLCHQYDKKVKVWTYRVSQV